MIVVALCCLLASGCVGRDKPSADRMKLLTERQLVTVLQSHGIQARAFPNGPSQGETDTHVRNTFGELFSRWHVTGGAVASKVEAFVTDSADHARELYRSNPSTGPTREHPHFVFSRAFTVSNVVVIVFSPLRVGAVRAAMRDLTTTARR